MLWEYGSMLGYWALDIMGTNEKDLGVLTENMAHLSLNMEPAVLM